MQSYPRSHGCGRLRYPRLDLKQAKARNWEGTRRINWRYGPQFTRAISVASLDYIFGLPRSFRSPSVANAFTSGRPPARRIPVVSNFSAHEKAAAGLRKRRLYALPR